MEEKRFKEWIILKEKIHNIARIRTIREGEVWWAALGENVGVEINGKNDGFTRPILVFKKLSRFSFLGVPLTTQEHYGTWYSSFEFKNKKQFAALSQVRILSVSRLNKRMGMLTHSDFDVVKAGFKRLYLG